MLKVKDYLRTALVCVVIAFSCLLGYLMLQNLCSELFILWGVETRKTIALFGRGFWLAFLVVAILYPLMEELIFRWLSLKLLKSTKMPMWAVLVVSAIIFSIYHLSWSQTIYQFLMGIWLGWIYLKTGQIGWTILIHFINNAFIVTYTYFAGDGGIFILNTESIVLSLLTATVTTIFVFFLIKKGIPNYEK